MPEDRQPAHPWDHLAQELEALGRKIRQVQKHTGQILRPAAPSSWPTRSQPDRISRSTATIGISCVALIAAPRPAGLRRRLPVRPHQQL